MKSDGEIAMAPNGCGIGSTASCRETGFRGAHLRWHEVMQQPALGKPKYMI